MGQLAAMNVHSDNRNELHVHIPDSLPRPRYEYDEHDCDEREMHMYTKATPLRLSTGAAVRLARSIFVPSIFPGAAHPL